MRKLYLLGVIVILAACAGRIPERSQYLLRYDANAMLKRSAPAAIGIGRLEVATYADGMGLVIETSQGEVHEARYHLWAEPLRESLRQYLAEELQSVSGIKVATVAQLSSPWARRIDFRIDQFHGSHDGKAKLVVYWTLIDQQEKAVLAEQTFVAEEALTADGYPALVAAHKKLLGKLSAEIATNL